MSEEVEVELLISAIHERPELWDKTNKRYHNRRLNQRDWETIAKIVGSTSDTVKKKWKNLRDTFAKELKKVPKPQSGADADNQPEYDGSWPFFESMYFIKDFLKTRKLDRNIITTTPVLVTIPPLTPAPVKQNDSIERQMSLRFRKTKGEALKAFIETEKQKKKLVRKEQPDDDEEDFHWFKSILPYMKQLPPLNKLRFRTQMQELLLNEISKINTPQTSHSQSDYYTIDYEVIKVDIK